MPKPSIKTVELPPQQRAGQARRLNDRSFLGLVATQFLTALNDNMFRWLVVPIGKDLVGAEKALSVGLACFVLPYLLLAAPAGYLADRFSKRTVIVGCKVAEIAIMALGVAAILMGNIYLMFGVLALMGAQSALFSPSKLGSIPEVVRADRISAANGIMGLTTVLAIIFGSVAGGVLYSLTEPAGQHHWWISAAALIAVATVGLMTSLSIVPLRAANAARAFPANLFAQTVRDLATLSSNRPLLLAALGTAFFWATGALVQINIDQFAVAELAVKQQYVGPLLAALALGIGTGSVLAGLWSAGKVELGMVPVGAAAIAAISMLMCTVPQGVGSQMSAPYYWTCLLLFGLGCGAGLYDVPLQAFLQHRSPPESRGAILAASNFITFAGMLLASGVFWLLAGPLGLSARQVFLLVGIVTVPIVVCIVRQLPLQTTRFVLRLISRVIYRVRVHGLDNLPQEGGMLLAPNHVSFADGVLLGLACPRHVRMVAFADYFDRWWLRWFARVTKVIAIQPGKRSVVQSIRSTRAALQAGQVVCIFPEGTITRTGRMQQFQPGFLSALKNTDAPVIPVYLEGLWGSIFSYEGGRFFWKWPRRWSYPVTIRFGRPIHRPDDVEQVHRAVERLAAASTRCASTDVIPPAWTPGLNGLNESDDRSTAQRHDPAA